MEQNGMRVEDFLNAIKKRWKMILAIIVIMSILGWVLSSKVDSSKMEYTIDSKIYVDIEMLKNISQLSGDNGLVYYNKLNNIIENLRSRTVIEHVLTEANSKVNVNEFYEKCWITLQKDSQVIKFEVIGNDKEEISRILNILQNKAIEITPIIIENSEAKVIEDITVVSEKDVSATSPILILLVLGGFGSIMLAFLLEYLDNSVKNEEQIEMQLNVPVLGKLNKNKSSNDLDIEYGKIRTNFKYSSLNNDKKAIVVASADSKINSGEIAKNLALSLSNIKSKTLIINNNGGSEILAKGLIDVLEGKEIVSNMVTKENKYLDSMLLGNISPNNVDILDSKSMDTLLCELKSKYEYLIINTLTLNSSIESQILVAKADGVILVAEANKTKVTMLEKSLGLIKNVNTYVIGIILK